MQVWSTSQWHGDLIKVESVADLQPLSLAVIGVLEPPHANFSAVKVGLHLQHQDSGNVESNQEKNLGRVSRSLGPPSRSSKEVPD